MAIEPPRHPEQTLFDHAFALHQGGQIGQAIELYLKILAADAENPKVLYLLGAALLQSGRYEESVTRLTKAQKLAPDQPGICSNLGAALAGLGRLDEAILQYDSALRLHPGLSATWQKRAAALRALGRLTEALADCERALSLAPQDASVHVEHGAVLVEMERFDEALEAFDRALALDPACFEAHRNKALVLASLKKYASAQESYEAALRLRPDDGSIRAALLVNRAYLCDWREREALLADAAAGVMAQTAVLDAFESLALYDDPILHRACAETMSRPLGADIAKSRPRPAGVGKIRIGYLSADFHSHATAYLLAEVIERHDRDRFEVLAFSTGPQTGDVMQARMVAAFDAFHDARDLSDLALADLIAAQRLDILVDLKGFTAQGRTTALAHRPAPVQVNFLGFPGTLGADYIDYIIGDPIVIPPGDEGFYAEKVVRLPSTYQPNSRRPTGPPVTRQGCGLPDGAIVFCSFNNAYKITPETFSSWMRIVGGTPGSVLWLLSMNGADENLRREAASRGVDPARLVFAPQVGWDQHLARPQLADIALDTTPYGSHTTASDALWMGVPLITFAGRTFASRVAASLVTAAGAPELVRSSLADCELYAKSLAADRSSLADLRSRLLALRETSELFDSAAFTRDLESAYGVMARRAREGQAPVGFDVAAVGR